ncbi:hypothetical protein [uncultured Gemmiger sp.]|uniref:hypothetical protein n=1 Tax=uncultured Gemmiger sp. TaxID=1623490 RepID=UPI0025DA9038|nr:hypothetical protein [uncultured Gemmiger sp.]
MDKEPHRREPPEYAPPGQEYAQPGRECADPGLEQQGERTRATDYASPRQEKNRGEREKLLRTMLLSTATVAVATVALATPSEPEPAMQEPATLPDDHYVVVNMTHEVEADGKVLLISCERFDGYDSLPVSPNGLRDGTGMPHAYPYEEGYLREYIIEDIRTQKVGVDEGATYYYDPETDLLVNPRPTIFTYYAADAPGEPILDESVDDWYVGLPDKDDGNIWYGYYIDPDLLQQGTTVVLRVDYPLGDNYYRDEYQYNLGTGEFTQTVDGQWIMQFDKYYDTKPANG